ncbi:shikimate kinase [Apilactobacillus sp. TMW 2.2459]|uniref:shikimate kinase n=1 Tax=Apilactobacillus xinyiensis TaxID=2841032 RepID=UPI00200C9B53|nr:shikimate kinase [Apilactobacillus xinyiensis]MCL0312295.1 shikimate kinase [Apilactobacillus xinyiensis]
MQVILIGFMGSGKSSTSASLAKKMQCPVYDLDAVIEERIQMPIAKYFKQHGEAAFRKVECDTLAETMQLDGILSTGGGTPLSPSSFDLIKHSDCKTTYLDASNDTIENHIKKDKHNNRPLVEKLGFDGLMNLKLQRHPTYQALADYTIKVDDLSVIAVVNKIIKIIEEK